MARSFLIAIARFGWAIVDDLWAILYTLVVLALASSPLAAWRLATQHLYRDLIPHLPLTSVLLSLALAWMLSAFILYRLYHSSSAAASASGRFPWRCLGRRLQASRKHWSPEPAP